MSDLFLKVEIVVSAANRKSFEEKMKEFIDKEFLQKSHNWQLAGAFAVAEEAVKVGDDGELIRDKGKTPPAVKRGTLEPKYIHIWKLPDDFSGGDVARVMSELNDVPLYKELDSFVNTESQDLFLSINDPADEHGWESLVKQHDAGSRFAFVRHYVNRRKLGSFAFDGGVIAPEWGAHNKWTFLGTYQSITGLLNVFWDVWQINESIANTVAAAEAKLKTIGDNSAEPIAASYRDSIDLGKDDAPHDGLMVAGSAPYWPAR